MPAPSLRERFLGSLIGHAVGDAACAPFEGLPATAIWYDFGGAHRILAKPPIERMYYTDDTQMTIAVAEALLRDGEIVEATLCERFVANYDRNRGYGQGARRIINAMGAGEDWRHVAQTVFPGGSLGNGAAMRVAPIGLLFHDDLDRVAEEARKSALLTHVHPVGVESAQLLAVAVALAVRMEPFDRAAFYDELLSRAKTEEFRHPLQRAVVMTADDSVGQFGSSLQAHRSVVTSIAAFTENPGTYTNAIATALALGDDVDTVAAMAGALAGARLGISAVPSHLVELLEDDVKGMTYIRELAEGLFELFESRARS
jgi:poly(ADP-ribose) glycohydrolase ARH3